MKVYLYIFFIIGLNITDACAKEAKVADDQTLTIKMVSEDGTVLSGVKCMIAPQKPKPKEIVVYDRFSNEQGVVKIREKEGRIYNLYVSDHKSGFFGEMTIAIPSEDKNSIVTFVLHRYLKLEGRVISEQGEPVTNMLLHLMQTDGDSGARSAVQAYTHENGRFLFLNLKSGEKTEIKGANRDWRFDWQEVEFGDPVIITATKAPPRPPTIHCKLVNSDGRALFINGGCYLEGPHPESPYSAFIEKGKFKLLNFPEGEYTLRVKGEDGQELALLSSSFILPCTNNTLEFVVKDKIKCVVLVRDERSSAPIAGSKVTISQMTNTKTSETDEQGIVTFDIWPGKMLVGAYADGYLRKSQTMLMARDKIVIDLCPGEVLKGVVVDEFGSPIQKAAISIFTSESAEKTAITDTSGEFMISGIPPGSAKMVVFSEGYPSLAEHLNITRTNNVKVIVSKGVQVSFDIDPKIEQFHDEHIDAGQLWVLPTKVFGIAGAVECKPGESKKVQLLPGTYDLYWVGKKNVFKVGGVNVSKPKAVYVSIREPVSEDVFPVGMFYKRVFGSES